jgi:TolA-binding protein
MRKTFIFLLFLVLVAGAAAQEERLFREAERRYEAGDFRFALSRYQSLVEEYPRSSHIADAHYRIAVIHYRLGEPRRALEGLNRVEQRYPYTRYYRFLPFWRGVIRYDLGEYERSTEELGLYLSGESRSFRKEAFLYQALAQRATGDTGAALQTAQRAVEELDGGAEHPRLLELYASLLVKEGRYEELYALFSDLRIEQLPSETEQALRLYRAEALFRQERYADAEPLYRQLLEQPGEARRTAYQRLFVLYQRTGREEQRAEIFDAAQNSLSDRPELLHEFLLRAGIESYKKGQYDVAESYLRRIWRSAESSEIDGLVPLYLSRVLEVKGEFRRAANLLEEYLPVAKAQRETLLFSLGRIYSTLGEWGQSASYLNELFAAYPDTRFERKATYLLAFARYKSGEPRRALAVIGELFSRGEEGELYGELLRLKSRLHLRLGELQPALDSLNEYLPLHSDDSGAYVDLARIRFSREEYRRVLDTAQRFSERLPEAAEQAGERMAEQAAEQQGEQAAEHYLLIRYMEGLSQLALGNYPDALAVLEQLREFEPESEVKRTIEPHLLFYLGWAYYEAGEMEEARGRFTELISAYPEHPRTPQAQYYAGWSSYARGDFAEAARFFAGYGKNAAGEEEQDRGNYLHAQSLAAAGNGDDALVVFRSLFQNSPQSPFADDALYEYAAQMERRGEPQAAAESYGRLHRRYPTSPLAEDALYARGEVLYDMERWEAARDAFYQHRAAFPSGELLPLSLYWGGKAAENNGEPYGAALLWEKLVEDYPNASLHRDGLAELSELYAELGEYEKALEHYTRLLSLYPDKAAELGAQQRIETLKRVLQGEGAREAELQVRYEQEGLESREGREAALELAKLKLYRYNPDEERARELLERLIEAHPDSASAARARYYLGEYHVKQGDWAAAARSYFDAAAAAGGDQDFVARAMYRAAEAAAQAGDAAGARQMVNRLTSEFPRSQWAREGRALLDELQQGGSR